MASPSDAAPMSRLAILSATLLVAPLLLAAAPPAAAQSGDEVFPGPDEVQARLQAHADHPWVTLHEVGESIEGRPILVAEVVRPDGDIPVEDRAVTFVLTQQHGNEPAGTPAVLDVLDRILADPDGRLARLLDAQVLLVLPMANPDGAAADSRYNADGVDTNRDHAALEQPETRAMHEVLSRWDVHVALDHHEYGGIGYGNPVPARVYDYDLTTLFPRHGNVRAPTLHAAQALMYEGIWPAAEDAGYSANEYGEVTAAGELVDRVAGGPDPGILRNHLGLHNVAGLLVESRVDAHPNPFHDAERRVDIHRVVIEATLEYVHVHAELFVHAKQAAVAETLRLPADRYVEGEERTGALHDAYRAPATTDLSRALAGHGLPWDELDVDDAEGAAGEGGTDGPGDVVVPIRHALEGHAAALVHPESSRALVKAEPTDALADGAGDAAGSQGEDGGAGGVLPAPGAVLVAAAVLAGAVLAAGSGRGRRKV